MNFASRAVPASFDVIIVLAVDSIETLGIDIKADLRNLVSLGLKVGLMSLSQGSNPKRYRNTPLVKAAFELKVPVLGYRDVAKTQLAIIYSPDLFLARGLRGKFVAQRLWLMVEEGLHRSLSLHDVQTKCAEYGVASPTFMAVTTSVQEALLKEPGMMAGLWNFHSADEGTDHSIHGDSWVHSRQIGVPTAPFTRGLISELKSVSSQAGKIGHVVCARTSVPSQLQTGRGEPDFLVGFPFAHVDRDTFLESLHMYIVPSAVLHSGTWRSDVYSCMRLGVPVGLPRALEPYFGNAATYYDLDIAEMLRDAIERPDEVRNRLKRAKELRLSRLQSRSLVTLAASGVEPCLSPTREPSRRPVVKSVLDSGQSLGQSHIRELRVCFVTSNGAGMGHLTRLLAVARRLDDGIQPSFVSMSQACGVVKQYGYGFEYIPSKGDLLVDGSEWNGYFNKRFMESLHRLEPDVVVFDGTWPYQGVAQAVANYDAKFVWMRRGMWRAETADTSLVRNTGFDAVIEPGDIASPYDFGATNRASDAVKVPPIIVLDRTEIHDRKSAREYLGIGSDERAMLLTLGAGNINKIDDDVRDVIAAVKSLPEKWRIFMTSPVIADGQEVSDGVENISVYPLARYAKAFDFVVSATGYNSFHEWIAYAVPTLWIANAKTITDDQIGRARYAHDSGLGLAAGPGGSVSIPHAIRQLGQRETRMRLQKAMRLAAFDNGARDAAKHISSMAKQGSV